MEIQKTMLSALALTGHTSAQAQLESAIPLPGGVHPQKVLSCEPQVQLQGPLCTKDGVQVTGLLLLHLTVETDGGAPLSFDASATFTHELSLPGVSPDMTARAAGYAPACACRVEEGGLRMQATLLLTADVFRPVRQECIAGIDEAEGLETQGDTVRLQNRILLGAHAIRLRESLDAPEGSTLLRAVASAEITRTANGTSGLLLEGAVRVNALYYDGEGGTVQRAYDIPFSDAIDGVPSGVPSASVEITQFDAAYDPDGSLSVEAALSISVHGTSEETVWILTDAYDSSGSFVSVTQSTPCLNYVGEQDRTAALREPVYVPNTRKDVTRVLYAAASPAITDTVVLENEARLDGLLLLSIVYRADDGALYGLHTDLPFSLPLDPMGTLLLPRIAVQSIDVSGSGRTLTVSAELKYGGEWYREETITFTTDLTPGEPCDPRRGILVYFPDPGETIFSVGKRFGVPTADIRAQNPHLCDPLSEGTSVILLRK